MSNLATMIMEGSGIGSFGKANLTHSYDHENGAGLIAMESAEALRDIFEAEFYVPNTCTIAAALEGASCVEESSQAAIMEASVKGAFEKIKKFFTDLKAKVLDFLHQIKRYLLGIFANDAKWASEYEKDLKGLNDKDLNGYEAKMYNYTIKQVLEKADIEKFSKELMDEVRTYVKGTLTGTKDLDESDVDESLNDFYDDFLKETFGTTNKDELDKAAWSKMRDGAEDESDKNTVKIGKSQIGQFTDAVKNSKKDVEAYDNMINKVNRAYANAIKFINDCENMAKKDDIKGINKAVGEASYALPGGNRLGLPDKSGTTVEGNGTSRVVSSDGDYIDAEYREIKNRTSGNIAMLLRKYSTYTSKLQSCHNTINTAAKTALQERNRIYKAVLVGAFSYAKKNKKKGGN